MRRPGEEKKGFPPGQDADSSRVPAISDPHARDRNRTDTRSPHQKQNLWLVPEFSGWCHTQTSKVIFVGP